MSEVNKNKGGRPRKHRTAEEAKAAANAASRASRQRKQQRQQQQQQQQADGEGLHIQFDPHSFLQEDAAQGNGRITVSDRGIQGAGLSVSADEEQRRLQSDLRPSIECGTADELLAEDIATLSIHDQTIQPRYRSQSQSVAAHINPSALDETPIVAEGDSEDIHRAAGATTLPLPSASNSPLPQLAETVEPAPLHNKEYNGEDADRLEGVCRTREPVEEPPTGDWYGAFDDDGDDGSARSTSPLTDKSLDEEDYINWAAYNADNHSVSDDDDGSDDEQIRQAEYVAEDQSDEVDSEQYTRAAAAQLKMAWDKRCTCNEPQHALDESGHSLAEITRFWQEQLSQFTPSGVINYPLDLPAIASRNEDPNDHRHIPWQPLLAGGDENPPRLSFHKSESRFNSRDIQIQRRWDVDSFIARATTLAAHRGGFNLAYRPPYLRRVTQDPRIRIQGHQIHKLKQLRLGQGLAAGGFGYECHVFFPHMAVKEFGETHLSDREQAVWIDNIILPALKKSCTPDVYQHHPHSFADVDFKAKVKQECYTTGTGQPMDVRYVVPESCLETFWAEVWRLSDEHTGDEYVPCGSFRDPFLVISGHGLKLFTKRDTFGQVRNDFISHLDLCFNFDAEQIPDEDCWLDLGIEDTPLSAGDVNRGVTLLRKLHCLDSWVENFACPDHAVNLLRTRRYHWALTRDAGSANVDLRQTNTLRRKGGIAYNKAYNINKELFATPFKGYNPFQNPQFEALGYSQDLLERWYSVNSVKGRRSGASKRRQLLASYNRTKRRLSSALRKSEDENYGVRQEYRITLRLLRELDAVEQLEGTGGGVESRTSPATNDESAVDGTGRHMPYWVLPTKEVNAFAAAELNRWLFLLEVLIGRVSAGHDGRPAASQEEQVINGVMVSALVRLLRMSTSTDPAPHPSMWRREWRSREWRPRGRGERESTGDDTEDSNRNPARGGAKQLGLDLVTCVKENGMAWFPVEPVHWNITPTFTSQAIKRLAIAANAFQKSFHKTPNIQRLLSREDAMFRLFRAYLRTSLKRGAIKTGAQLCIRSYIQDVIALLAERWGGRLRDRNGRLKKWDPKERLEKFIARAKLEDDEALGLRGLSWVMVTNLIGGPPRIVGVRQSKAGGKTRNGKAHFTRYDTGLWKDKVFALFAWDDERADAQKKRGWHNAGFRLFTRRLHSIVVEEAGESAGRTFLAFIKDYAAQCLWAIPQYDYDKLSVMYKASKHHSQEAREEIAALSPLERINWLVPQMSAEYESDFHAIQRHYSQAGRRLDERKWRATRSNLIRGLHISKLAVYSSEDNTARIPKDPRHFGKQPELSRAVEFMEVLNERIAEQEAESEEDLV